MGPVIVGYINTTEGRAAALAGAAEARLRGAPLVLASHRELSGTGWPSPEDQRREERLEAEVGGMRDELAAGDLDVATEVLRTTHDAGSALAGLANERMASLLVIGVRQRSRVGKLIMGSSAQSALLQADCPVLSIKSREGAPPPR